MKCKFKVKMAFPEYEAYSIMIIEVEAGTEQAGYEMISEMIRNDHDCFPDEIKSESGTIY